MSPRSENFEVFNRDVENNKGYLYTTNRGLSSRLATQNSVESVMAAGRFRGRSLVDVGCGDGHYSLQYWDSAQPHSLTGVDAAERAVELANQRKGQRQVSFRSGDSHNLPFPNDSFDVALLQAMLHHDDDPLQTIREAFRVAPEVVIHEPNGCNLGLKIIEKLSHYHREHAEKSYTHWQLRKWIEQAGGEMVSCTFTGFVPMFCPDWIANITKALEPLVEWAPVLNTAGCAVYTIVAKRRRPESSPAGLVKQ
jgi:ubiquinone/menaquinone biosynthesis C-methylase UbiE